METDREFGFLHAGEQVRTDQSAERQWRRAPRFRPEIRVRVRTDQSAERQWRLEARLRPLLPPIGSELTNQPKGNGDTARATRGSRPREDVRTDQSAERQWRHRPPDGLRKRCPPVRTDQSAERHWRASDISRGSRSPPRNLPIPDFGPNGFAKKG